MKVVVFKKENGIFKGSFKNISIEIKKLGRKRYQISLRDVIDNKLLLTYCDRTKKPNLKYLEEYFEANFRTLFSNKKI